MPYFCISFTYLHLQQRTNMHYRAKSMWTPEQSTMNFLTLCPHLIIDQAMSARATSAPLGGEFGTCLQRFYPIYCRHKSFTYVGQHQVITRGDRKGFCQVSQLHTLPHQTVKHISGHCCLKYNCMLYYSIRISFKCSQAAQIMKKIICGQWVSTYF